MFSTIFNCINTNNSCNPVEVLYKILNSPPDTVDKNIIIIKKQIYRQSLILEELDNITKILRKEWNYLQSIILNEEVVSCSKLIQIREEMNKCLQAIVECFRSTQSDSVKRRYRSSILKALKSIMNVSLPISEVEELAAKLSPASLSNDNTPIYLYFHCYLDLKFHQLILYELCGDGGESQLCFDSVMSDFVQLGKRNYYHKYGSAFVCGCHKDFWIILQNLNENFWIDFNKSTENCEGQLVLWLLKDVASLQIGSERLDPNYDMLQTTLKNLLTKTEPDSKCMLEILKSVNPIVCNLWIRSGKIEVYHILWEYYSRRLNVSLRSQIQLPFEDLVELLDKILFAPAGFEYDFELFLGMLSMHLNEHPHHWGKIKGRIYSQLGPNKVKDLNDTGMFHVLLLFTTLSRVNFEELTKKFVSFVESLPLQRKLSLLVWRFYAVFIIRYIRENRSIEPLATPFVDILEEASSDPQHFYLIKSFVADFELITKCSSHLQLSQWLLLDSWTRKYMSTCYHHDLVSFLNVLLTTIERINSEQVWPDWEAAFKNNIYPGLKFVCSSVSAPEVSGSLAAKITLNSNLLTEAFSFFNSDSIVPNVASNFLCEVLENYPNSVILSTHQQIAAVQSWVKLCLLTKDNHAKLTRQIVKLDVLPDFLKNHISNSQDPLCSMIDCLSSDLKQYVQSGSVNKLCEVCFSPAERWISQYLTQPDNEAIVLRIYTCIALAFYKIGPLLYHRYKNNCPYIHLMSTMLLPTELMIGKPINPLVLQAVRKTWHLFFEAAVNLNTPSDTFIERTSRDLVVKYIPYFAIIDSPMIKCLDNERLAEVILDKMANAFFKQPSKEAESNVFKSLRIINDFVQATTSSNVFNLVIGKTLYGLFEVVMFHTQRNTALGIVKTVTSSALYAQAKASFEDVLISICEKHVAFNTTNCFQLLELLAKFIPGDLKGLMPRVKRLIANVERMRGVGYDKTLRLNLEKLEASLL